MGNGLLSALAISARPAGGVNSASRSINFGCGLLVGLERLDVVSTDAVFYIRVKLKIGHNLGRDTFDDSVHEPRHTVAPHDIEDRNAGLEILHEPRPQIHRKKRVNTELCATLRKQHLIGHIGRS